MPETPKGFIYIEQKQIPRTLTYESAGNYFKTECQFIGMSIP